MALLLLAVAVMQTLPQVTLQSRGETVEAIVRKVSQQTGVAMATVPETGNDIVIVSVKNCKLKSFQDHLAEAIGAKWHDDRGVLRLVRPKELIDGQIAAERKLRILEVTAGLESLQKKVHSQAAFDAPAAHALATQLDEVNTKYKGHLGDSPGLEASIALEPRMPSGRLAVAAVATLTPEQLADIEPGGRIVYSTDPTPMQRPIAGDLTAMVARFRSEQQLFEDEVKRFPIGQGDGWYSPQRREQLGNDEIANVLLITERSPYNPNLSVTVRLIRKDGRIIGGARSLLDLAESSRVDAPLAEGKFPLSPQSLKFMGGVDQLQKGKTFLDDRVLVKQLTQPEQFDPLSYVAADGVLAIAKDRNVIACIPDTGFIEPAFTAIADPKNLDLTKFSNWLTNNCVVAKDEAWLTASPRRMVETRALRVDRRTLGSFLRNSIEAGGVNVDDTSAFVSHMPDDYMDSIAPMMGFFVLPDLNAAVSDRNVELLRVYGRLTLEQKIALKNDQTVSVQVMTQASRADLNHLFYRADAPIQISFRSVPGETPGTETIANEITFALPNGVPASGLLSMAGSASDAVIIDGGTTPTANYRPMTANMLASQIIQAQHADPTDKRQRFEVERYRFGHSRNVMMELNVTSMISVSTDFHETNFPRNKESIPFSELPESFRKAVEVAMAQLKSDKSPTPNPNKIPPP